MTPAILFPSLVVDSLRTYPYNSTKAKGRGYYNSGGLHTVSITTAIGFIGIIKLQGTLSTVPTEDDWVDIEGGTLGDGITALPDQTMVMHFTGNFVWVRASLVELTAGELNRVLLTQN